MRARVWAILAVLAVPILACGQCAIGYRIEQTMTGGGETVQWIVGAAVVLCFMVFAMVLCSMGFGGGPRRQ